MIGRLKEKVTKGEIAIGTFVKIPSLGIIDILGELEFDFLILDMEHSPLDFRQAEGMLATADAVGISSVIRVPDNQEHMIAKALDIGCDGVQVPMIESYEDAERMTRASRYYPAGNRGISFATRAARYGILERSSHIAKANASILSIAQVESWSAAERADSIASAEGLDIIFVGPADLSQSLGFPGQSTHPKVFEAIDMVGKATSKHGKVLGAHVNSVEDLGKYLSLGVKYLVFGSDFGFFMKGAREAIGNLKKAAPPQR